MRKQSKQALQAVTTNTITQVQTPPSFPGLNYFTLDVSNDLSPVDKKILLKI